MIPVGGGIDDATAIDLVAPQIIVVVGGIASQVSLAVGEDCHVLWNLAPYTENLLVAAQYNTAGIRDILYIPEE